MIEEARRRAGDLTLAAAVRLALVTTVALIAAPLLLSAVDDGGRNPGSQLYPRAVRALVAVVLLVAAVAVDRAAQRRAARR